VAFKHNSIGSLLQVNAHLDRVGNSNRGHPRNPCNPRQYWLSGRWASNQPDSIDRV